MSQSNYDVIIIGGGVLGCMTARELSRFHLKTALLEKNPDICAEVTKANTAIIYPGYDSKPGSLKAKLCVNGNKNMEALCKELSVPFKHCGSLMVAAGPKGEEKLRKKLKAGKENSVPGIKLISGEEARLLEPALSDKITLALYAETTATLDPWALGIAAAENAAANGVDIYTSTEVTGIINTATDHSIQQDSPDDSKPDESKPNDSIPDDLKKESYSCKITTKTGASYTAQNVVCTAGLYSDTLTSMICNNPYKIVPQRADFIVLDPSLEGFLSHILFCESEDKGKSVSLVPAIDGPILIGSSKIDASGDKESRPSSEEGLRELAEEARDFLPDIPLDLCIRTFTGLRPNPYYIDSEKSINDFIITEAPDSPGFIYLMGIKTPGLSCAGEIAKHVTELAKNRIGVISERTDFDPSKKTGIGINNLPEETIFNEASETEASETAASTEKPTISLSRDSIFNDDILTDDKNRESGKIINGNIVCRCRKVTEKEIIEAIHRMPCPPTLDGIKRRTGTCMGRCQGGYCTQRILEIVKAETDIDLSDIEWDRDGSWIVR